MNRHTTIFTRMLAVNSSGRIPLVFGILCTLFAIGALGLCLNSIVFIRIASDPVTYPLGNPHESLMLVISEIWLTLMPLLLLIGILNILFALKVHHRPRAVRVYVILMTLTLGWDLAYIYRSIDFIRIFRTIILPLSTQAGEPFRLWSALMTEPVIVFTPLIIFTLAPHIVYLARRRSLRIHN